MTHDNKLQVEAIKRGTVIDHIPAQVGFKLLTLFKLTETDQRITIGLNLPSGEMGRKDLIKIENTFLTDEQVNQLSLYAPQATVNRIDDYEVVGKSRPSLPDRIDSVLVCPNSNCISHAEPVSSSFGHNSNAFSTVILDWSLKSGSLNASRFLYKPLSFPSFLLQQLPWPSVLPTVLFPGHLSFFL